MAFSPETATGFQSFAATPASAAPLAGARPLVMETVSGVVWDHITARFDGICQEQVHAYAAERWPGVQLEPVLFSDRGDFVGGALVMIQNLPLRLGSIALVKWGPILADGRSDDADAIMAGMVARLVAEYGQARAMMVSIMPKVEPSADNGAYNALLSQGFAPGIGLRVPERYVVALGLADDARMAAFGQKWRYHLKKSFKSDLSFERAGAERLGDFMALYDAMIARKQFVDHSGVSTLPALMAMADGTARPELFFVRQGEEIVAGAVIFTAGDTATYLYGATSDRALGLRAGYFMHWHIIAWLRDHTRARWYDLGGTDGFAGLHQFKSGMVGSAGYVSPCPPVANFAPGLRMRLLGNGAFIARDCATRLRARLLDLKARGRSAQ